MDYLKYLTKEIHSTVMATVDENTLPVTCAIDIMDYDENGLYFLTAKGKNFYARLKTGRYVSLTGKALTRFHALQFLSEERLRKSVTII